MTLEEVQRIKSAYEAELLDSGRSREVYWDERDVESKCERLRQEVKMLKRQYNDLFHSFHKLKQVDAPIDEIAELTF